MTSLPLRVLLYGKDEPLPERVPLRAGPVSLVFEAGDLRYLRVGNVEILRRVYVAVRDRDWNTILPRLFNVDIQAAARSFHISFDCHNRAGEIDFFWRGTISGAESGQIYYTMAGEARSTFWRNRIGICVLHPAGSAGAACAVEHPDGSIEPGTLPVAISPHQPAFDIRAFIHEAMPGFHAEVRFTGDIFEMEDQRNWTDASFKTYSTPLRLPYPVEVSAGTKVEQAIVVSLSSQLPASPPDLAPSTLKVGATSVGPLPLLGLGQASHGLALSDSEGSCLAALNLSHLRVDLDLADPSYPRTLGRAVSDARRVGAALELALFLSGEAETQIDEVAGWLTDPAVPVRACLVFHVAEPVTTERWVTLVRQRLAQVLPDVPIGAGTNTYFTVLNRNRPNSDVLDLVCYSINPQVHAFDNSSLIETLAAQATTVASARRFVGSKPIIVSPISLRPRFNPDALGPVAETQPGELPSAVDVRQMSLFGAAWTVGSLKYLATSGVASATYYETTGWRGVMETDTGSPLLDEFRSIPGGVFPLYHVLATFGEFAGGSVIGISVNQPLEVDGLVVEKDGRRRLILANMQPEVRRARIEGLSPLVKLRRLDETNVEMAMSEPELFRTEVGEDRLSHGGCLELDLLPYAVVWLDFVEGRTTLT